MVKRKYPFHLGSFSLGSLWPLSSPSPCSFLLYSFAAFLPHGSSSKTTTFPIPSFSFFFLFSFFLVSLPSCYDFLPAHAPSRGYDSFRSFLVLISYPILTLSHASSAFSLHYFPYFPFSFLPLFPFSSKIPFSLFIYPLISHPFHVSFSFLFLSTLIFLSSHPWSLPLFIQSILLLLIPIPYLSLF